MAFLRLPLFVVAVALAAGLGGSPVCGKHIRTEGSQLTEVTVKGCKDDAECPKHPFETDKCYKEVNSFGKVSAEGRCKEVTMATTVTRFSGTGVARGWCASRWTTSSPCTS
ncbi:unnamed protein product [Vitrella brassicaformis CCMP3155]|uniref:Uncharacterized protein n=2 Tax=Vitrella brassicaformis TaxID=1169539 RepID=A0A0G4EMK8_VITBC|nr:unnamed protein product [Vitrella brassicaformis CCMP3155]|eukprot:CEL98043.1 unnamed protein product [Vitrella brassicaformis CCMP3155]